jgi:two-component system sensor histidine kinase BarA
VHGPALREAFAAALGVEAEAAQPAPTRAAAGPLKAHVLLVEDEAVNAAVGEGYLEALGCTSTWVTSGAEAVACAAAEHFDLILMDLSMPGMDGFATTALIRRQESRNGGRRVPIVALTAHDAVRYRDKCLAADIDDILSKPYTLDDCRRLLRHWLAGTDEGAAAPAQSAASAATDSPATLGSPLQGAPERLCVVDTNAVAALRRLGAGAGKQADLYAKLVDLFRASSTRSVAELTSALDDDDLPAVAAVCHKLAAAAANVGALAYAEHTRKLEQQALAGQRASAAELAAALCEAHLPLLDALQSQRLRATA